MAFVNKSVDELTPRVAPIPAPTQCLEFRNTPSVPDVTLFDAPPHHRLTPTTNIQNAQQVFYHANAQHQFHGPPTRLSENIFASRPRTEFKNFKHQIFQSTVIKQLPQQIEAHDHITAPMFNHSQPTSNTSVVVSCDSGEIKQILEIVKQNAIQINTVLKENENLRTHQEQMKQDFCEFQTKINEITKRQNAIESKLCEIEINVSQMVHTLHCRPRPIMIDKFVNTDQKENKPWTPIWEMEKLPQHMPNTIPERILPPPTEPNTTSARKTIGNSNSNIKQLYNKYAVDGSGTPNRRCVDFSVNSLNYMQRHGLLDGEKLKK